MDERRSTDDDAALERLRAICLALPEASEEGGVGNPSFKVRGKIFAMRHPHDDRMSVWLKAPPGAQGALVHTSPRVFFVPPYVGHHGWVGAWLDIGLDWEQLAELIEESYRMTAPKRLVALLDRH
ncbi:MAG TPA: MmcQ/YjbR family DNA-binding protein [Ktedonobacterales bacterium]|nr:MmcQ/YjbR family DNA-binding protein [Ktedonobacterales bacterium]